MLQTYECESKMNENRISIHVESERIFFGNKISKDRIYLFMQAQQGYE